MEAPPTDERAAAPLPSDAEQKISQCLRILDGKSDEHKFAGLLMITKLERIDDDRLRHLRSQVIDIVGTTFFLRLLSTRGDSDGLSPFQSLGLNLIASFCDDAVLADRFAQEKLVSTVLDLLSLPFDMPSASVQDCVRILFGLIYTDKGKEIMCQPAITTHILVVAKDMLHAASEKAGSPDASSMEESASAIWRVVVEIVQESKTQISSDDLAVICSALPLARGRAAIEIVALVNSYMEAVERSGVGVAEVLSGRAISDLRDGIVRFIRAKWSGHERDACLKLVYLLMHQLGMAWALVEPARGRPDDVTGGKFVLLVLKLVSVEIKLMLDEVELALLQMEVETVTRVDEEQRQDQEVQRALAVLPICYGIVESVIAGLVASVDEDTGLPLDVVLQLKSAFADAVGVILEHLTAARDFIKTHRYQDLLQNESEAVYQLDAIVFASVRVASAWLAEDSDTSINAVLDLLPFLVCYKPLAHHGTVTTQASAVTNDFDSEEAIDSDDEVDALSDLLQAAAQTRDGDVGIDQLHFLLPGLLQISAMADGAQVLAEDVEVLKRVLQFCCTLCTSIASGHEHVGGVTTLTLCLGVLMNVLLLRDTSATALPHANEWYRALSFLVPVACASGGYLMEETALTEDERGDDDRYVMVLHVLCVVLLIHSTSSRTSTVPAAVTRLMPQFNRVVAWMQAHPPDASSESAMDLLELCRGLALRSRLARDT